MSDLITGKFKFFRKVPHRGTWKTCHYCAIQTTTSILVKTRLDFISKSRFSRQKLRRGNLALLLLAFALQTSPTAQLIFWGKFQWLKSSLKPMDTDSLPLLNSFKLPRDIPTQTELPQHFSGTEVLRSIINRTNKRQVNNEETTKC